MDGGDDGEIQLVVGDFGELTEVRFSDTVQIKKVPWRLMVNVTEATNSSQSSKGKCLGVYLQCVPDSLQLRDGWSISVQAVITLVNHLDSNKGHSKEFSHCFCPDSLDWGYSPFVKWKDVVDTSKGYLQQESIVVKVQIHVKSIKVQSSKNLSALACPACAKEFACTGNKQPMSLKCGHTFCCECLRQNCSHSTGDLLQVTCFLCNQEHSHQSETQLWFPNHCVIQMIDNVVVKSKHFCEKHQHDKTFYCLDDNVLVCIYCMYMGDHVHHKCEPVDKARQQVEPLLGMAQSEASIHIAKLGSQWQLLKDEKEIVKSQQTSVVDVMENFFTTIENALQAQKKQLIQELITHSRQVESTLDEQMKKVESESVKAKEAVKQYRAWKKLPARDALDKVLALMSQLKSVSTEHEVSPNLPTAFPKLSFEIPCSDVLTSIGRLGHLKITQPHPDDEDNETGLEVPPLKRKKTK